MTHHWATSRGRRVECVMVPVAIIAMVVAIVSIPTPATPSVVVMGAVL